MKYFILKILFSSCIFANHGGCQSPSELSHDTQRELVQKFGERLHTAGYESYELQNVGNSMQHNDTTFYESQSCHSCFAILDLDTLNGTVVVKSFHEGSGRHLYAIPITFKFTFFGALRENVTISTEGFLSFKDNGAKIDLLKLQQVSALRADFELTKDSDVRYVATDDTLVVEWKDLVLQNSSTPIKQKRYHFQVVLAKNNTVTINYIKIPSDFKENIHDHQITSKDSVIAGMSDALQVNSQATAILHQVFVNLEFVRSALSVRYTPYSPCHKAQDCWGCANRNSCTWCTTTSECFKLKPDQNVADHLCPVKTRVSNSSQCDALYHDFPTAELIKEINNQTNHYKIQFDFTDNLTLDGAPLSWTNVPTTGERPDIQLNFTLPFFNAFANRIRVSSNSIELINQHAHRGSLYGPDIMLEIEPPLPRNQEGSNLTVRYLDTDLGQREGIYVQWKFVDATTGSLSDQVGVFLSTEGTVLFQVEKWSASHPHENDTSDGGVFEAGLFASFDFEQNAADVTELVPFLQDQTMIAFQYVHCEEQKDCNGCHSFSKYCRWSHGSKTCHPFGSGWRKIAHIMSMRYSVVDFCGGAVTPNTETNASAEVGSANEEEAILGTKFYDYTVLYYDIKGRNRGISNLAAMWNDWEASDPLPVGTSRQKSVKLDFQFPFFGFHTQYVAVSIDGYLVLPSRQSNQTKWGPKQKYNQIIAPLRNSYQLIDQSLGKRTRTQHLKDSGLYYGSKRIDGIACATFEWRNVVSRLEPVQVLSFKAVIFSNGTILFVYKDVMIEGVASPTSKFDVEIKDDFFEVPDILEDGATNEGGRTTTLTPSDDMERYKSFHSLDLLHAFKSDRNVKSIRITPLPTCGIYQSCLECTTQGSGCFWCSSAQRCMDADDKYQQAAADPNCLLSSFQIENENQCRPKVHISQHRFYNRSWIYLPNDPVSSIDPFDPELTPLDLEPIRGSTLRKLELPFPFKFYDMSFSEAAVSPNGYIEFLPRSQDMVTSINVFRKFHTDNQSQEPSKVIPKVYHLQRSDRVGEVVFAWGNSFEASLKSNGAITFKYFDVPQLEMIGPTSRMLLHGVGIKMVALDRADKKSYTYSVDWVTKSLRNGLTIRFEPLPSCSELYGQNCTSCMLGGGVSNENNGCFWCHQTRTCQEVHLPCKQKQIKSTQFHCNLAERFWAGPSVEPTFWDNSRGVDMTPWITCVAILCLVIFGVTSVVAYGFYRPTSLPGHFVVRLRMSHYRLLSDMRGKSSAQLSDSQMHINEGD